MRMWVDFLEALVEEGGGASFLSFLLLLIIFFEARYQANAAGVIMVGFVVLLGSPARAEYFLTSLGMAVSVYTRLHVLLVLLRQQVTVSGARSIIALD